MINLWECSAPGCEITAMGVGGAIGLQAIGWHFFPGRPIFCPFHRPDGEQWAEVYAKHWQQIIMQGPRTAREA